MSIIVVRVVYNNDGDDLVDHDDNKYRSDKNRVK